MASKIWTSQANPNMTFNALFVKKILMASIIFERLSWEAVPVTPCARSKLSDVVHAGVSSRVRYWEEVDFHLTLSFEADTDDEEMEFEETAGPRRKI